MNKREKLEKEYNEVKQRFKDVSKNGKDYMNCSIMDIVAREKEYEYIRDEFIIYLGTQELKKIEEKI